MTVADQSERFDFGGTASPPAPKMALLNYGHWPREASEHTMFSAAYTPSTGGSVIYITERPTSNTARQSTQPSWEEHKWDSSWPVADNPLPGGGMAELNAHQRMSYVTTAPAAVQYPDATNVFRLYATPRADNNAAWGTGLTAPAGACGTQGAHIPRPHNKVPVFPGCYPPLSWQERPIENGYAMLANGPADSGQHQSYPLVRNHPIRSVMSPSPYLRPTTRREFRSNDGALMSDILYEPYLMCHDPNVGSQRDDTHRSTSLVANDRPATSFLPQTLIPGVQVPHYLPDAMHVNCAGSSAFSFNGVGTFPLAGHQQEGAADPSDIPHETGCGTSQQHDAAPEDDDVLVNPFTIKRRCGWNGCQTLIHPDRMQVRKHFVGEHNVRPGAQLVVCVHPKCRKEMKADSLWQHWITHLGVKIQCTTCSIILAPRVDSFKRHVLGDCSGPGKFIRIE